MKLFLFSILFASTALAAEMPVHDYKFIPASNNNTAIGGNLLAGDIFEQLIIIPETVGGGPVSIRDGLNGAAAYNTTMLVSGSLTDLHPIVIEMSARSVSGDWSVTTGVGVHVIAVGRFQ